MPIPGPNDRSPRLDALDKAVTELHQQGRAYKRQMGELQSAVGKLSEELARARQDIHDLQRRIRVLQGS